MTTRTDWKRIKILPVACVVWHTAVGVEAWHSPSGVGCHFYRRHKQFRRDVPHGSSTIDSVTPLLAQNKEFHAEEPSSPPELSRREVLAASLLLTAAAATMATPATATATTASIGLPWEQNPINKRSGIKVQDAEAAGYNVGFVTYLTRFLLSFDSELQQYWISHVTSGGSSQQPTTTTSMASSSPPEQLFGELAASVEVKLLDYAGRTGASRLLQDLLDRYCPNVTETTSKRTRREIKEARRQLALLFALLPAEIQPVTQMTALLAQIDNARVVQATPTTIRFYHFEEENDDTSEPPVWNPPSKTTPDDSNNNVIIFPPPVIGNARAQGLPVLSPPAVVGIRMTDGGSGYTSASSETAPLVSIHGVVLDPSSVKVTVKNGRITQIQLLETSRQSTRLSSFHDEPPPVIIAPPHSHSGNVSVTTVAAKGVAVMQQRVVGVNVTQGGAGYVLEKPIPVYVGPAQYANATATELNKLLQSNQVALLGTTTAVSETSSYSSFRTSSTTTTSTSTDEDAPSPPTATTTTTTWSNKPVSAAASGPDDGLPALPFWNPKSSSATFLRLFPAGVGVEYDETVQRYFLVVDQSIRLQNPNISRRPLGPEFGPRGRAPVERDRDLTLDTLVRFGLSGAICASGVHVALTPLDVVKTKVQTNPQRYPTVPASFTTVYQDEGLSTFFSGWAPTLAGNFASGAAVYTLTEFIRRSLSEQVGPASALTYEVPIILAAAAVAASVGSVLSCPFEAVRIRQIAQPTFAPNAVAVFNRLIQEEGWISLAKSIPVFLIKNVPYAMTKFTIFDLSTERMYAAFPQATENLKLSLLVSLLGGCLGGTAAAVVSNPADALLSELKKAKSDIAPTEAAAAMWQRGQFSPFFKGLPVRLVYYSLIASLQFLVYDGVRFGLGIGADDLKLYLDVLGGALQETGGPL